MSDDIKVTAIMPPSRSASRTGAAMRGVERGWLVL